MLLNHVTPDALACAPFTLERPTKKAFLRLVEPRRLVQIALLYDVWVTLHETAGVTRKGVGYRAFIGWINVQINVGFY
jgi:hypothetical protein